MVPRYTNCKALKNVKTMKGVLIFAGIAGIVVAGVIFFLQNLDIDQGQVMNVEDGFPVDA